MTTIAKGPEYIAIEVLFPPSWHHLDLCCITHVYDILL
jgi:hypothetical protein